MDKTNPKPKYDLEERTAIFGENMHLQKGKQRNKTLAENDF